MVSPHFDPHKSAYLRRGEVVRTLSKNPFFPQQDTLPSLLSTGWCQERIRA